MNRLRLPHISWRVFAAFKFILLLSPSCIIIDSAVVIVGHIEPPLPHTVMTGHTAVPMDEAQVRLRGGTVNLQPAHPPDRPPTLFRGRRWG